MRSGKTVLTPRWNYDKYDRICALDRRRCRLSSSCAVHPVWVEIRHDVEQRLKRETIKKLLTRRKSLRS